MKPALQLAPPADPHPTLDIEGERLRAFGRSIDGIRKRIEAEVGDADVRHVVRLNRFSRGMEVAGRLLLHVSLDPVSFTVARPFWYFVVLVWPVLYWRVYL